MKTLASKISNLTKNLVLPITIALSGCAVNSQNTQQKTDIGGASSLVGPLFPGQRGYVSGSSSVARNEENLSASAGFNFTANTDHASTPVIAEVTESYSNNENGTRPTRFLGEQARIRLGYDSINPENRFMILPELSFSHKNDLAGNADIPEETLLGLGATGSFGTYVGGQSNRSGYLRLNLGGRYYLDLGSRTSLRDFNREHLDLKVNGFNASADVLYAHYLSENGGMLFDLAGQFEGADREASGMARTGPAKLTDSIDRRSFTLSLGPYWTRCFDTDNFGTVMVEAGHAHTDRETKNALGQTRNSSADDYWTGLRAVQELFRTFYVAGRVRFHPRTGDSKDSVDGTVQLIFPF